MTQELVLMVECRDEMGAVESGVVHDLSVAGGEAVWEAWWTLSHLSTDQARLVTPQHTASSQTLVLAFQTELRR